jgi:hypothetical protein
MKPNTLELAMTANDSLRRLVYPLLITVAVGMAAGRVLGVVLVYEPDIHRPAGAGPNDTRRVWPTSTPLPMPTFSSNDRSRWATVRALVDDGTYVIGKRDRDVVLITAVNALGAAHTLQLAVLLDAGYEARASKVRYRKDRVGIDSGIVFEDGYETVDKVLKPSTLEYYSSKPPLLATMVAGEYWLLKKAFGWTLTGQPFEVVRVILLTVNVLPFALYLWLLARLLERYGATDWGRLYLFIAAAFGTLVTPFLITFNNHTIAVVSTMIALYATLKIWESPDASGGWYALAGVSAGFTVCNEFPAAALAAGLLLVLFWRSQGKTLFWFVPSAVLPLAALLLTNYIALGRLAPAYSEFGGPWYEYEGSHWRVPPGTVKQGIDWAGRNGETKPVYAFHLLLGHHGVFSMTPIFLLTVAGLIAGLRKRSHGSAAEEDVEEGGRSLPYFVYPCCLVLSAIVIGYYIYKSNNYGGWSNGPRWLMWLTPMWLLTALPVVDRLGRSRWGRGLCLALLALSVLSANYDAWNPWRHPWLYRWFEARGWISY